MRLFKLLITIFTALLLLSACSKDDPRYIFPGTEPEPNSILTISPANASININTSIQYTATIIAPDGTKTDVTDLNTTTWSSENNTTTIDTVGRAKGIEVGSTRITVEASGLTASTLLSITDKTVQSLNVTPNETISLVGLTTQFNAELTFNDNTTQDVTDDVNWSVSNSSKVTVDTSGLVRAIAQGNSDINASFGMVSDGGIIQIVNTQVSSLEIKPSIITLPIDATQAYTGVLILDDNSTIDVTDDVIWTSTDAGISSISSDALLTAHSAGDNEVYALISFAGQTLFNSAKVTVLPATLSAINVTPKDISVPVGTYGNFFAEGTYSDGSTLDITHQVAWTSSDDTVGTIDSNGLATAHSVGVTEVTATLDSISGFATATVTPAVLESITVIPLNSILPVNVTKQYHAYGYYSDKSIVEVTDVVSWTVADAAVGSFDISEKGLLSAIGAGSTKVTATMDLISGEADLTVVTANLVSVTVTPGAITKPAGTYGNFIATAAYESSTNPGNYFNVDISHSAIWSSTLPDKASVDTRGLALALEKTADGSPAIINAVYKGASGSSTVIVTDATLESVVVTPQETSVVVGLSQGYSAMGIYTDKSVHDLTAKATWRSSDTAVAYVNSLGSTAGIAYTYVAGSTTITAAFDGKEDSAELSVTAASITSLQITPADLTVVKGSSQQYSAIAYFDNGTSQDVTAQASWSSTPADIVGVIPTGESGGQAKALAVGSSEISAVYDGVLSNTAQVEVTDATLSSIVIDPVNESVANGVNVQYRAMGIYSDDTFSDITLLVTWISSDTSVATIAASGASTALAYTHKDGNTTISATLGLIKDSTTLSVTAATVESIQITPADETVPKGTSGSYSAIAYYSDSTSEDVTDKVAWVSTDTTVVSIVSTGDNAGYAKALNVGSTTIKAYLDEVPSNTAQVTVTAAILENVQITPNNKTLVKGTNEQYFVHAIYSDLSSKDVTAFAQIQSLNTAVVTFDGNNMADAVSVGDAELTTTYEGVVSEREFLHVVAPKITSIQVTPADLSIPKGTVDYYTATAFYDNGDSADVTALATWVSADPAVVNIVTSGAEAGYAEAVGAEGETTTISATLDGMSDSVGVTILASALESLTISPINESVAKGLQVQYMATGIYLDGTSVDLTLEVTWQSLATDKATIESSGLATAVSVGATTISATLGAVSASTTLTVTTETITSIQVTPASVSVPRGTAGIYTAVAYYSDNTHADITQQATWISADPTVAKIVSSGLVGGVALAFDVGSTTITASFDGTTSNAAEIEVTAATITSVEIIANDVEFPKGTTVYYEAVAHYGELVTTDITLEADWTSANSGVATVVDGEVYGVAQGSTQISILFEGLSDVQDINVTEALITGLIITPADHNMSISLTQQYLATAQYDDGSTKNVTSDVTWISSDTTIAAIESSGLATALVTGATTITAAYEGVVVGNSATLNVFAAAVTLDTIVVTPANDSVTAGSFVGYTATGHYSNGTTKDITEDVTWQSSLTSVATIEATGALMGVAVAIAEGTTDISATLDGLLGSTPLNVTASCGTTKPDSIEIRPDPQSILLGESSQLHLTGIWTENGCEREVTYDSAAVWSTDDSDIATMGSKGGQAFGHAVGTTNVNAKFSSRTYTGVLNVTE